MHVPSITDVAPLLRSNTMPHNVDEAEDWGLESWSDVCRLSLRRPLNEQLVVTRASLISLSAFMLLASVFAGLLLYKFCRLSDSDQNRVWNQYRLFSILIFAGGALGVAAWLTYMESLSANFRAQALFKSGPDFSLQTTQEFGRTYLWLGIHFFFEPLTFACLTVSKFLVLDRIFKFITRSSLTDQVKAQFEHFLSIGMRVLVFLNVSVVVASWTSLGFWIESYRLQNIAADEVARNVPNPDFLPVQEMTARARRSAVAVHAAELIVLLSLALAFILFGGLSLIRLTEFGQKLTSVSVSVSVSTSTTANALISHASQLHRSLWLRIVCTVVTVFCSFILRCIYNAMYVTSHQASITPECADFGNCAECQDKLFVISNWMDFTPEFVALITLVSEPITMLIALWAMSTHTMYGFAKQQCSQNQSLRKSNASPSRIDLP